MVGAGVNGEEKTHVKTTVKVQVDEEEEGHSSDEEERGIRGTGSQPFKEKHINQYTLHEKIGEGAFGTVYRVTDGSQDVYALKEINKKRIQKKTSISVGRMPPGRPRGGGSLRLPPSAASPSPPALDDWDMIKREIAIMKKLRHRHVIKLVEVLNDDELDCLYMVMDYAQKGPSMKLDLNGEVDPLPIETAWKYFRELVLGVEYLHFQSIAHRDLKPDNILIDESDSVKIVDFGVSEMFQGGKDSVRKSAGSPAFMSPEMCSAKGASETFSAFKGDIWAMGVVLFCMTHGQVPFRDESVFLIYEKIREEEPNFRDSLPDDLKDLFKKILAKNPDERISIAQIKDHPWVTKGGESPLPSSAENCSVLVSVTDEETRNSITKLRSVSGLATVVKAVNRFRRTSLSSEKNE